MLNGFMHLNHDNSCQPAVADAGPVWALTQVAGLFRGRWRLLTVFILSSIGRSVASVAVLLLIQSFLANTLNGAVRGTFVSRVVSAFGESGTLWVVGLLLFLVHVTGSAFNYANFIAQQHVTKCVELGAMEVMIRHLLGLSVPFFDRQSHGDIIETILKDVAHLRLMVRSIFSMVFEGFLVLGLVATMAKISLSLSILALVVVPASCLPLYMIATKTFKRSTQVRRTGYMISDIILEVLRSVRTIRIFQAESALVRQSMEKGEAFHDALIGRIQVERIANFVMDSLGGLLLVVVVMVGGRKVMAGELAWANLLAFIIAIRGLFGPVNNLSGYYVNLQVSKPSVQRIAAFLAKKPEIVERPDAVSLKSPLEVITFDHVNFSYGNERVLQDVSFRVRAGETIGIVSPSGGGKSTLLSLLVRFYDPTSGAVRFDGLDLRDMRLDDLYSTVTLVTQEPFIFSATVRENIRFGRPSASDAEVEAAARAAYVHDEIVSFTEGYQMAIGVGGRDLSVGQKQRIAIARALLKNAPILLLDEATSALDSVSEAEVHRAVERLMLGRTCFVVAHRLSTLRSADRLLVLDDGVCAAFAPHEELIRDCTLYRKLWKAQATGWLRTTC